MHADAEIDPDAPLPPYRQLAEILRARIARGDWARDKPITALKRLAEEYELAETTVARTIKLLVEEGDLYVVPRRGTYVSGK